MGEMSDLEMLILVALTATTGMQLAELFDLDGWAMAGSIVAVPIIALTLIAAMGAL
jgi:hypothetical protein